MFIVKPQALLREEAPELDSSEEDETMADDSECGNNARTHRKRNDPLKLSVDSHGVTVMPRDKLYPDFSICQYWGSGPNKPDIVHVIVEVGSSESDKTAIASLAAYLDRVGPSRSHTRLIGVGQAQNEVCVYEWERTGECFPILFTRNFEWISLFDERLVKELNAIVKLSRDTDKEIYE